MKKQNFILGFVLVAFGFLACDNNEVTKPERTYSDEEILSAVRFVGQGGFDNSATLRSRPGEVVLIRMTLGRKSQNCSGFGFCSVQIAPWDVWYEIPGEMENPNIIFMPYDPTMDLSQINLYLAEMPGIDMRRVLFPIDENIELLMVGNNNNLKLQSIGTVQAQQAVSSQDIGEFGGFSLNVLR